MKSDLLIIKSEVNPQMLDIIRRETLSRSSEILIMAVRTPGGSPMHAYRAMIFLRSVYKKIIFIVFDEAMSAGTLMALGSDYIYLEDGACLGPLDLQISHPTDDSTISTLDVRDTASATVQQASVIMLQLYNKNREWGLRKSIAMDAAIKMASDLYRPIMEKIDPFHLHESYRNADLSASYGANLLLKGMTENRSEAVRISTHLANNYYDHGYAIIKEEAKSIGLRIMECLELSNKINLDKIKSIYDNIPFDNVLFMSADSEEGKKLQVKNKKENK